MPNGITFTSNSKVTIDLKKYGDQLMDFFRSIGVEEKATKSLYSKKFIAKMNKSRKEFESGKFHEVDPNNIWD